MFTTSIKHFTHLLLLLSSVFLTLNATEFLFNETISYKDFSFVNINNASSCQDILVQIDPNYTHLTGIIHSPNYKQNHLLDEEKNSFIRNEFMQSKTNKCNWILNVPDGFNLKIILIDINQTKSEMHKPINCSEEKLSLSSDQPGNNIQIKYTNTNTKVEEIVYANNKIDTCSQNNSFLKIFTQIEVINTKQLSIDYETNEASLKFLLSFQLVKNQRTAKLIEKEEFATYDCNETEELKCFNILEVSNNTLRQHSCIKKDLLCNCLSLYPMENDEEIKSYGQGFEYKYIHTQNTHFVDNCDFLLSPPNNFILSTQQASEKLCSFYHELNEKCTKDRIYSLNHHNIDRPIYEEDYSNEYNDYSNYLKADKAEKMTFEETREIQNINPCSYVFRHDDYGWIASPNFYTKNQKYDYDLNCSYQIQVQPYQTIQLRFKYFNLDSNIVDFSSRIFDDIQANSSESTNKYFKRDLLESSLELTNGKRESQKISSSSNNPINLMLDYDYLSIYDGPTTSSTLIARFTQSHNDFNSNFNGRVINSNTNRVLIVFHTQAMKYQQLIKTKRQIKQLDETSQQQLMGFNLTYQIKGLCIEDQLSCNSLHELNCYSKNQTCNDIWDCHNGADEKGCGLCKPDQFRCRNHIFCYRLEERCDGDHQCVDKSDELNCDRWFCNSDNGTFLCNNGRCVYEQWVCDGTNDCEDGSDEIDCPTSFTSRRVITTAVLGGTLCCLLLVMALGCACKLYSLHTVGYRNTIRLSQSVQSTQTASSLSSSSPLINNSILPSIALSTNSGNTSNVVESTNVNSAPEPVTSTSAYNFFNNLVNFLRRPFTLDNSSLNNSTITNPTNFQQPNSTSLINSTLFNNSTNNSQLNLISTQNSTGNNLIPTASNNVSSVLATVNELPLPHHSIAPPTYNQTMGLVDEYEQRQLAFIEHVRSILSQQQHTSGNNSSNSSAGNNGGLINLSNPLASLTLIPTVGSSSTTTVHRVTSSSSSGRRSHSSRHHRHHHHHLRSTSTNIQENLHGTNCSSAASNNNQNESSNSSSSGSLSTHRSNRSNRHRHSHLSSHHRHHTHQNGSNTGSFNIHHQSQNANNTLQDYFDANRRGLIQFQQPLATANIRPTSQTVPSNHSTLIDDNTIGNSSSSQPSTLNSILNKPIAPPSITPSTITTASSITTSGPSNTSTTSSVNLRDRIAKLIKDIVVNHGDNIQYVQLANHPSNNSISSNVNSPSSQLSSTESIISNLPNNGNFNSEAQSSTSSNSNGNSPNNANAKIPSANEEDEPLIQA